MGFISKHLPPVVVFFNEPENGLEGFVPDAPTEGMRLVAVKSCCLSDGSSRIFYKYKVEAPKKLQQTKTPREKRVKKK